MAQLKDGITGKSGPRSTLRWDDDDIISSAWLDGSGALVFRLSDNADLGRGREHEVTINRDTLREIEAIEVKKLREQFAECIAERAQLRGRMWQILQLAEGGRLGSSATVTVRPPPEEPAEPPLMASTLL